MAYSGSTVAVSLSFLTWLFFSTLINHLNHVVTCLCFASAMPLASPLAFLFSCHLSSVFSWQFCSSITAGIIISFTTASLVFLFCVTLWQSLPAQLVFFLYCIWLAACHVSCFPLRLLRVLSFRYAFCLIFYLCHVFLHV